MVTAIFFGAGPLAPGTDTRITAVSRFFFVSFHTFLGLVAGANLTTIGSYEVAIGALEVANKIGTFRAKSARAGPLTTEAETFFAAIVGDFLVSILAFP